MAKIRVAIWGTTGKSVAFDPNSTVGAQIGVNLLMPDGSVATIAKLISTVGGTTTIGSSSGVTAHRLLSGLALGDDHPQYTRRDILTTRGDLYVEGASALQRLAVGGNHQVLMSNGTDPGWVTLFANPTASVGLAAVNGSASTAMRSDGAPALDQAIVPSWTGQHTFSLTPLVGAVKVVLESRQVIAGSGLTGGGALTGNVTLTLDHSVFAAVAFSGAYSDLSGTPTIPTDIHNATFLTSAVEAGLPNSREVLAGTNVTFDDTTPGQRTINVAGAGSGTVTSVSITAPAAGITQSGSPVTTSGAITLALANDLAALEGLGGTGIAVRSAADTWVQRTITGTANRLAVANGDGVAGNPTLNIDTAYVGQSSITTLGTITTGVWHGTAIDLASYATGILPAASFPTLTGDVTTAGGALATTIANDAVTYAKMQNVSATSRVLGRITAGAGDVEELTATNLSTILGLATIATSGSASDLGSGTLPAGRFPTLTGDVTTAGGALATTIANLAVTYAKIQNVSATSRILGRITAGAGSIEELTSANVKTILGLATVASSGAYSDLSGTPTIPTAANPTASAGLSFINGSAATFMRSDGAPKIDQTIVPTWTGLHTFGGQVVIAQPASGIALYVTGINSTSVGAMTLDNADLTKPTFMRFARNAAVFDGYIGTAGAAGQILTGSAQGDMCIRGDTAQLLLGTSTAIRFKMTNAGVVSAYEGTYNIAAAGLMANCTIETGSFTATLTGCTTAPTATINWCRVGNIIIMQLPNLSATSNTTACTITGMTAALAPASPQRCPCGVVNATTNQMGFASISGAVITLNLGTASATFTNSGTKGVFVSTFCYQLS